MPEHPERHDPFIELRNLALAPGTSPAPDPVFAARLRARIERALSLPKGVTVSGLPTPSATGADLGSSSEPPSVRHEPGAAGDAWPNALRATGDAGDAGGETAEAATQGGGRGAWLRQGDVAYASLWVPDGARAERFFAGVVGWSFDPAGAGAASGRTPQVRDVLPHHGLNGGNDRPTLFLCFAVEDLAEATERVRRAGGEAAEPTAAPHGLTADCRDDQGMVFALWQLQPDAPRPGGTHRPGELIYITIEVPDSARFRRFFSAVLGWSFEPGHAEDGWQVPAAVPMCGLHGGHAETTVLPMYAVRDLAAAVEEARALGGRATDPTRHPYGLTSDCEDDQGTRFYLIEV
jgi:predicted enzyme related to lactoylglutathione lyase